jgi:hypothetical protein
MSSFRRRRPGAQDAAGRFQLAATGMSQTAGSGDLSAKSQAGEPVDGEQAILKPRPPVAQEPRLVFEVKVPKVFGLRVPRLAARGGPSDETLLTGLAILLAMFLPRDSRARWLEEWRGELAELLPEERPQFLREVLVALVRMLVALRRPRRRWMTWGRLLGIGGGSGVVIMHLTPLVQALVVAAAIGALLVVLLVKSDQPTERLVALIRALRGR